MNLPKILKTTDERYQHLVGKPALSYSQIQSWLDPTYKAGYIKQYICGIKDIEDNKMFAEFGSACGTYLEGLYNKDMSCHDEYRHLLSDFDRGVLDKVETYPNSVYEDYLVIDRGDYVIQGYADRTIYKDDTVIVEDFKTGSIDKKHDYYRGDEYIQTDLYAYILEQKGYKIEDCRVTLFDRKGNGTEKHPIRLTGEFITINRGYNKKLAEKFLKQADKVAKEISDFNTIYQKLLK